jgi:hypothetical protein
LFAHIRKQRLILAAADIINEDRKIIDTALDFMFDSHEGFTRSFVKEFGITPSALKQGHSASLIDSHDLNQISIKGEETMEEETKRSMVPVFIQIMKKPERKLIVKRGEKAANYFDYCNEVGCEVWDDLGAFKNALTEPMGMWLPNKMIPEGTSKYVQGVEFAIDADIPVPEGFDLVILEPVDMMLFQGPAFDDEDFEDAISTLWDFIEHFDPLIYGYRWAKEKAPRFQYIPEGYRGYIEGLPVEKVE